MRRPDALPARLAPLPLTVTRWPARTLQALATLGVRAVGDCMRLPRDGFARRFEPRLRLELDRALGRAPDPRATFAAAERCVLRRDLEPEIADTGRLRRALEPLLEELCAYLQGRGAAIESLELRLLHREAPATRLRLRFAEPVAAAGRIAALLQERLARTDLPEAVRAVRLRSGARSRRARRRAICSPTTAGAPRPCRSSSSACALASAAKPYTACASCPSTAPRPPRRTATGPRACAGLGARASEGRGSRSVSPRRRAPLWLLTVPQPLEGDDPPCYEGPLQTRGRPRAHRVGLVGRQRRAS